MSEDVPVGKIQSKQQPLWHVVLLTFLTLGAYSIIWFYRTWRDLDSLPSEHGDKLKVNAVFGTFLMLLPIAAPSVLFWLSPCMLFWLSSRAAISHPDPQAHCRTHPLLAAAAIVVSAVCLVYGPLNLPDGWRLLYALYGIPLAVVQSWVNAHWKSVEPKTAIVRHAFSGVELVLIIVGSMFMALNIVGYSIKH